MAVQGAAANERFVTAFCIAWINLAGLTRLA